jgi:hypothetical protein
MAETLPLLRMRPIQMDPDRFRAVASALDLGGDLARTDEALALRDEQRTLVYAQPGSRLAGVLLFVDQRVGVAQQVERVVEEGEAAAWAERFLGDTSRCRPALRTSGSASTSARACR